MFNVASLLFLLWSPIASARDVNFCLANVVISPAKSGGFKWDLIGKVDDDSVQKASNAFGAALASVNPIAGAAAAVVIPGLSFASQPDTIARVQIIQDGETKEYAYARINDTLTPDWASKACTLRFDADRKVRIRISFTDVDDANQNDDIGSIELSSGDLKAAIKAQQIMLVDTRGQGTGLVWGVGLSVIPE